MIIIRKHPNVRSADNSDPTRRKPSGTLARRLHRSHVSHALTLRWCGAVCSHNPCPAPSGDGDDGTTGVQDVPQIFGQTAHVRESWWSVLMEHEVRSQRATKWLAGGTWCLHEISLKMCVSVFTPASGSSDSSQGPPLCGMLQRHYRTDWIPWKVLFFFWKDTRWDKAP